MTQDTPVNLNKVRKAKARMSAKATADQNAVRYGQTKALKEQLAAQAVSAARLLSGHQREDK